MTALKQLAQDTRIRDRMNFNFGATFFVKLLIFTAKL